MHSKTFIAYNDTLESIITIRAKLFTRLVPKTMGQTGEKDPLQYSRKPVTKPAGAQEKIA